MLNDNRRYCTVPNVFGLRTWFEKRYSNLCKWHDGEWLSRNFKRKILSDVKVHYILLTDSFKYLRDFWVCLFCFFMSFFIFHILGLLYWLFQKLIGR